MRKLRFADTIKMRIISGKPGRRDRTWATLTDNAPLPTAASREIGGCHTQDPRRGRQERGADSPELGAKGSLLRRAAEGVGPYGGDGGVRVVLCNDKYFTFQQKRCTLNS